MAVFACPNCRAEIQSDLIETTGAAVCPFCAADLSELGLPEPSESGSAGDAPENLLSESAADRITRKLPPLPEKSRIKVVEANEERLVLFLAGGGKQARGLGCFALMWNLFMCAFTPPWFFGAIQGAGNNGPPVLALVGFLGLFWAVGLGMAWFWVKMKYERTFLLVERHRLVVQKVLFNRKRTQETTLMPDSRAELVEAYQQNDVPVYRIEVKGQDRPAKFGTALADEEKDWIVDRINELLDVVTVPVAAVPAAESQAAGTVAVVRETCRQCGAPLTGDIANGAMTCAHCGAVARVEVVLPANASAVQPYERLDPADVPAQSGIRIEENSAEGLEFSFSAAPQSPLRWFVPLFALPFSLAWYSGIFAFIGGAWQIPFLPMKILFLAFSIPFLIVGLFPLAMGLIAFRGRTSVRLTPEYLACRWHCGWLKYSRKLSTRAIERVGVESLAKTGQNPRVRGSRATTQTGPQNCCVARAGSKKLYLTMFQEERVARLVASLLRTRLEQMGHTLRDA